jgi:hypothetical protein
MSHQKTRETRCLTCSRTDALKINADVLQRSIASVLPTSSPRGPFEAESTPGQLAAATWHSAIGVCLKREMASHPRCAGCGILMGPGHLETGIDWQCRSCRDRCTHGQKSGDVLVHSRPLLGRRGWHSGYAIKR